MRDELKPLVSMYHCCVEADGRSEDQQNASRVRKLEESNLSREDLKFRGRRFDESEMSREHSKPDASLSWGGPLFSSSLDKDNSADVSRLVASVEVRKIPKPTLEASC
jgi:hypothetical protein